MAPERDDPRRFNKRKWRKQEKIERVQRQDILKQRIYGHDFSQGYNVESTLIPYARNAVPGAEIRVFGVPGAGKSELVRRMVQFFEHDVKEKLKRNVYVVPYDPFFGIVSRKYGNGKELDILTREQSDEVIFLQNEERNKIRQMIWNTPGDRSIIITERPGVGDVNRGQFFLSNDQGPIGSTVSDRIYVVMTTPSRLKEVEERRGFIRNIPEHEWSHVRSILVDRYPNLNISALLGDTPEENRAFVEKIIQSASPEEIVRINENQSHVQQGTILQWVVNNLNNRALALIEMRDKVHKTLGKFSSVTSEELDSFANQVMHWELWAAESGIESKVKLILNM